MDVTYKMLKENLERFLEEYGDLKVGFFYGCYEPMHVTNFLDCAEGLALECEGEMRVFIVEDLYDCLCNFDEVDLNKTVLVSSIWKCGELLKVQFPEEGEELLFDDYDEDGNMIIACWLEDN